MEQDEVSMVVIQGGPYQMTNMRTGGKMVNNIMAIWAERAGMMRMSILMKVTMSLGGKTMIDMILTLMGTTPMNQGVVEAVTGVGNPEEDQPVGCDVSLPLSLGGTQRLLTICLWTITGQVMRTIGGVVKMQFQEGPHRYSCNFETIESMKY